MLDSFSGIAPVKELWNRFKETKEDSKPNSDGMLPVRTLATSRACREQSIPNTVGICWLKVLSKRKSCIIKDRRPSSDYQTGC